MRKVYHLANCTTCQRILGDLNLKGFDVQNIKEESITESQIDEMKALAGSYESLFSRRAMKYRSWGLGQKTLSEKDYRDLIVKEYTFLKRPVFIIEDEIFIGNTAKVIEKVAQRLE